MDSSITDGAANLEAAGLEAAGAGKAGVNMHVDDGGHALLDLLWPMPIGLLVMGSVVAAFFAICSMLH
jgi:hypothetical protein